MTVISPIYRNLIPEYSVRVTVVSKEVSFLSVGWYKGSGKICYPYTTTRSIFYKDLTTRNWRQSRLLSLWFRFINKLGTYTIIMSLVSWITGLVLWINTLLLEKFLYDQVLRIWSLRERLVSLITSGINTSVRELFVWWSLVVGWIKNFQSQIP